MQKIKDAIFSLDSLQVVLDIAGFVCPPTNLVKVGVGLAGATAAAATVTVAATVTDYQSGHVRTADEFASHLAAGTVLGAVTGATLYGLWYGIPGASILMGADLAGLFASSSPVAAVAFSKAAALAGYFLMGSQVIRYASEISSLGTGYNWMLEQLFGGDAVTYSDATTLMDALAAYTVIVGWENMPEKLKESRENLIKYGKMDTSLIGEGTGEPLELSTKFLNKNDQLWKNADNIKPIDGHQDIVCHGDQYSFVFKNADGVEVNVSVKEFAEILQNSPVYNGGPIRLISCETGAEGAVSAQYLANYLNVEVIAPTDIVYVYPDGDMIIGLDNSGFWKTFKPGGN